MATRRDFLRAAGAGFGCAGLGAGLVPGFDLGPEAVRYGPEIEPLVRWLEDTPRERLVAGLLGKVAEGMSYRDGMAVWRR